MIHIQDKSDFHWHDSVKLTISSLENTIVDVSEEQQVMHNDRSSNEICVNINLKSAAEFDNWSLAKFCFCFEKLFWFEVNLEILQWKREEDEGILWISFFLDKSFFEFVFEWKYFLLTADLMNSSRFLLSSLSEE